MSEKPADQIGFGGSLEGGALESFPQAVDNPVDNLCTCG